MENAADEAEDWTEFRIAAATKAVDLSTNTIFLCCEGERGKGRGSQGLLVGGSRINSDRSDKELEITHTEGCGVGGRGGIFTRTE
jgi:hypothetical protein